jgi:hypothetical protein
MERKVVYFRLIVLHALVVNHPLSGADRWHQTVDEVEVGLSARFRERLQRALFLPTVGSRHFCLIIATVRVHLVITCYTFIRLVPTVGRSTARKEGK